MQTDLKLASLFTDHMVLQRERECPVWGWAQPGQKVAIEGSWGAKGTATADSTGAWKAKIKTGAAGGPYTLKVNQTTLNDVMVGEVWLCSGQSNMEMFLNNYRMPVPVVNWQQELATADRYPKIRLFQVARKMSDKPEATTTPGAWQVSSQESAGGFSAVGFFFARKLVEELNIPVGMIHSSWGGTEVELWTSEPGLRALPELGERLDTYRANVAKNAAINAEHQEALKRFVPTEKTEWSTESFDASSWRAIDKPGAFEDGFDGAVWFRAVVQVPASLAGQTGRLKLGLIDDDEKTWVNGTAVGETRGYDVERNYEVKNLKAGRNVIAIRAFDGAGPGGFSGAQTLEVGGQKLPLTEWRMFPVINPNRPPQPQFLPSRPFSTLYNGMIHPLAPYAMRGALWYQGESNVSRAEQYRRSFPNMIKDWRKVWGQGDFPFYFVQIAPFAYTPPYGPELREAQTQTLSLKNTGMALTTDLVNDLQNIHPIQKREVGERLARIALARDYGKAVTYQGPTVKSISVLPDGVRVFFDHAKGLNGSLEGFQLAGKDGVFVTADARIDGEAVVLKSTEVPKPVWVRYGWSDTVYAGLKNGAGLPAFPFRSDALPWMTQGVRW